MPTLVQKLRRLRRRLALLQWMDCTARALLVAAVAACTWLTVTRFFPQLGDPLPVALGLGLGAVLGAALWTWLRRPALLNAALAADAKLGLKERFTSSLVLQARAGSFLGGNEAMAEAVHRDAARHLDALHPRMFRLAPSHSMRWLAVPLLLFGLGYVFLPEIDLFGYRARQAEARTQAAQREEQARMLEAAARVLPPEPLPAADAGARDVQVLEKTAAELRTEQITKKQALARVQKLRESLREKRGALANKTQTRPADSRGRFNQARSVAEAIQRGRPDDAKKELEALRQKLQQDNLSAAQKKQLAEELKGLNEMLGRQPGNQELAGALDDAFEQMEMALEDMASAMEQLAKMDAAMQKLAQCETQVLGPSTQCRSCGKTLGKTQQALGLCKECKEGACKACGQSAGEGTLKHGKCGKCAGSGQGPGIGQGPGNRVGDRPEGDVNYDPAMLRGTLQKGKLLGSVLQRAAPETPADTDGAAVSGTAITSVGQQAETALTKEEIPAGSREYVRQYFGVLENPPDAGQPATNE
ncbi:MAG: hypothetical protein ACLFTT_10000 [Candidatus Hydrogenedentota bacterium]